MSLVKMIALLPLLFFLVACATKDIKPHDLSALVIITSTPVITCKNPRPEMCNREHRPVCGLKVDAAEVKKVTYANGCVACSDVSVKSYQPNSCAKDPTNQTGMLNKTFFY
jgi:hypothetical protein